MYGGGESEGRAEDCVSAPAGYCYQGFRYTPQGNLDFDHSRPWRRLLQIARMGKHTLSWIEGYRLRGIAAIIAYDPYTPLLLRLGSYARRHGLRLIVDLTEWPTGRNFPGGILGPYNLDSEFRLRCLYRRQCRSVIGISSFLTNYYCRAACRVVRIPPLVDLEDPKWKLPAEDYSGPLRLVYAGNPGKKDLLANIVRGLMLLRNCGREIEFHLVGVTEPQVAALCGNGTLPTSAGTAKIICHGRVPQNEVPRLLGRSHFSVLLRPDEKYAHAGFPTKIVESLSAGTPAIVNATSDIAEYVRDGREGFIVPGYSPEALAGTLRTVAAMPPERIREMKNLARSRAREAFDYHSHRAALERFLTEPAPLAV